MPGRKADSFSLYDDLLAAAPASDPWTHTAAETPAYEPDYGLLGELLTIPVRASALSESGIFAKGPGLSPSPKPTVQSANPPCQD